MRTDNQQALETAQPIQTEGITRHAKMSVNKPK